MSDNGCILGIDPGLSGGWAVLNGVVIVDAGDIPVVGRGPQQRINAPAMKDIVLMYQPKFAVIEDVWAMPGERVSTAFRFGRGVGAAEGIIGAHVSVNRVSGGKWKRHFGLPGKAAGGGEMARQRVIELFPGSAHLFSRKKDHNRAEAALLAQYGAWRWGDAQDYRFVRGT